jgi:phage shock protein A
MEKMTRDQALIKLLNEQKAIEDAIEDLADDKASVGKRLRAIEVELVRLQRVSAKQERENRVLQNKVTRLENSLDQLKSRVDSSLKRG